MKNIDKYYQFLEVIHSFRHSYGTLINGYYGNTSATPSVLGHTDASISQIYMHPRRKKMRLEKCNDLKLNN